MSGLIHLFLIVGAVLLVFAKAGDAWAAWDRKRDPYGRTQR